jgi:hypothetical protein
MGADPMRRSARPRRTRWSQRGRVRVLGLIAAAVVVGGCGGSTAGSGGGADAGRNGATAGGRTVATTASGSPGSGRVTSPVRGKSTVTPGKSTAGSSQAQATARMFSGQAGAARFRVLVGDVCLAVRAGAPAAVGRKATDAELRTHVLAGADAATRTLTAFGRLQAPAQALGRLRPLTADYRRLQALYASVLAAGAPAPHAFLAELERDEQQTAAAAIAAGVPGCAPATTTRGG